MKDLSRKDFILGAAGTLAATAVAAPAFAAGGSQAAPEGEADFALDPLEALLIKNEIQELMADYWWYMDTKQWDRWEDVFTEDVELYLGGSLALTGNRAFREQNENVWLLTSLTCHQGHQNKIVITSPTTAVGRFVLNDVLTSFETKSVTTEGHGYYINDFEKCPDGKWRIRRSRLGYLRSGDPSKEPAMDYKVPYDTVLS